MIEVYIPFVLLVLSWNSADPAGTMEASQRLFLDQRTCIAAGQEFDRLIANVEENEGSAHTWRCIPQVREIEIFQPASPAS